MNRNTFLQGFVAGQRLRGGANASVRVEEYQKQDFFNGLACGMLHGADSGNVQTGTANVGWRWTETTRQISLTAGQPSSTGNAYIWNGISSELTVDGVYDVDE
jgi:hypothetical protein